MQAPPLCQSACLPRSSLSNLNRFWVFPKGEFLRVPIIRIVNFGVCVGVPHVGKLSFPSCGGISGAAGFRAQTEEVVALT